MVQFHTCRRKKRKIGFTAAVVRSSCQKASAVRFQVVDMPLLFETSAYKLMWPRITVTCSHEAEVSQQQGLLRCAGYIFCCCLHTWLHIALAFKRRERH